MVTAVGEITGRGFLTTIGTVWLVGSAAAVVLVHPRGVSGFASGQNLADARDDDPTRSRARGVDPRSMGIAVVALITVSYLGFTALTAIAQLSPAVGGGFGMLGVAAMLLATAALVPYLIGAGVVAIRREGLSRLTVLPLLAAAGLVGPVVLLGVGLWAGTKPLAIAMFAVVAVTGYLGFLFLAFLGYGQWYARRRPRGDADAVVVLGSRVFGDRVPPLLAARIDRGIEAMDGQLATDPDSPVVLVCSGGQGSDETMPEGEAMARYAAAHGVPDVRLLKETGSRNTRENLTLTSRLLTERGLGTSMVAVTNDFHAFRASLIAREVGIEAQVIGAPTAGYYFPAAVIREFVGVLSLSPVVHAVVAIVLAVTVGGLAALALG